MERAILLKKGDALAVPHRPGWEDRRIPHFLCYGWRIGQRPVAWDQGPCFIPVRILRNRPEHLLGGRYVRGWGPRIGPLILATASGFIEHKAESHRTTHEMDWISQAVFSMGVGYM